MQTKFAVTLPDSVNSQPSGPLSSLLTAPLTLIEREQLCADAKDVRAAAQRKNLTCDDWDAKRETAAAKENFELGCWLFYYSRCVGLTDSSGLLSRVDSARRIFLAGINNPGYQFFTVFDFGERQFDTIFEMGDSAQVIGALRSLIAGDQTGQIARAFNYFGWPVA